MNVLTYREWSETCTSLHLVLQMMGKTKLAAMVPQPEWGHVVLFLEPDGFSTGLVSTESGGFEVRLSVESAEVHAASSSGLRASFSLGEAASTSERYRRFQEMLDQIGHPLPIDPMPQEMSIATPFDKMVDRAPFDTESARKALRQFLFAHNALGRFSSAFRGKRTPPSLYWGTFDLTTTLFSGEPLPFDPTASIVERAAFDEELMEFGFWPGDERTLSSMASRRSALPFEARASTGIPASSFCPSRKRCAAMILSILWFGSAAMRSAPSWLGDLGAVSTGSPLRCSCPNLRAANPAPPPLSARMGMVVRIPLGNRCAMRGALLGSSWYSERTGCTPDIRAQGGAMGYVISLLCFAGVFWCASFVRRLA